MIYRAVYRCASGVCRERLTWGEVMDSHGVCPRCCAVSKDTIVGHTKESELLVQEDCEGFWRWLWRELVGRNQEAPNELTASIELPPTPLCPCGKPLGDIHHSAVTQDADGFRDAGPECCSPACAEVFRTDEG